MADLVQELEAQIAGVKAAAAKQTVGVIREIGDGVAKIEGLGDVMLNEMLDFGHGITGLALNLDETEVAYELTQHALRIDPRLPSGHFILGRLLEQFGDEDGALAAYSEAIRIDPTYSAPYDFRANILESLEERELALADRAIAPARDNPSWRRLRTPRTYARADASPFPLRRPQRITFDLLPTSVQFRAGDRIRIAIAYRSSTWRARRSCARSRWSRVTSPGVWRKTIKVASTSRCAAAAP